MINPRDLRIGNILQFDPSGLIQWVRVDRLNEDENKNNPQIQCSGDSVFADSDSDELEYVSLDNEVLEKCNFALHSAGGSEYWETFMLPLIYLFKLDNGSFEMRFIFGGNNHTMGEPLNYLHQLQNRYFSLTNKEMEINF